MIKFNIPGMYENADVNLFFLKNLKERPQYFYDDVEIGSVYGNFQFCIWDGGRIFGQYRQATKEKIEELLDLYNNKYKIPIRLIFTNTLLKEEDCYDAFGNLILSMCQNGFNEVVVNSPILTEYIAQKYPDYKIISSTTKCIQNFDKVKAELDDPKYSLVCLDYNLNHNMDFLNSLTQSQKDKTEFLINAICPPGCTNRKTHYDLNSSYHLTYGKSYRLLNCGINENPLCPDSVNQVTHISMDEIKNTYYPMGFSNYKLEGRTFNTLSYLCNCIPYLVKPEYCLYILNNFATN